MLNKTQNSFQNSEQNQEQPPKKEPLSFVSAKTLSAILIFTALAVIIIGGWMYAIGKYQAPNNNQEVKLINDKNKMFYCDSKKDCFIENFDCSSSKCDLKAINKNYLNEICKNFKGDIYELDCMEPNYDCVNNKCEIVEDDQNQHDISDLLSKASATDGWQTYQNEEFGFEFKYPKEWNFPNPNLSPRGSFVVKSDFDNLTDAHFLIDAIGHAVDSPSIKKEFKKTIFAGKEAEEFNLIDEERILREIRIIEIDGKWTKDNNIFYYVENDKKDLIPIFNQILSTFKFID